MNFGFAAELSCVWNFLLQAYTVSVRTFRTTGDTTWSRTQRDLYFRCCVCVAAVLLALQSWWSLLEKLWPRWRLARLSTELLDLFVLVWWGSAEVLRSLSTSSACLHTTQMLHKCNTVALGFQVPFLGKVIRVLSLCLQVLSVSVWVCVCGYHRVVLRFSPTV